MRRLILSILVLFTAGCGDATGPEEPLLVGTYTLTGAGSEDVPATISRWDGQRRVEIIDGHLTLNEDLTFTQSITWRITRVDSVEIYSEFDHGTYEPDNHKLWMNYESRGQLRLMVNGQKLSLIWGGLGIYFEPAADPLARDDGRS